MNSPHDHDTATHRYCPHCRRYRALDRFRLRPGYPPDRPYYQSYCIDCNVEVNRQTRAALRRWRQAS